MWLQVWLFELSGYYSNTDVAQEPYLPGVLLEELNLTNQEQEFHTG